MTVWDFFFKREGRISRVSLLIGLLAHNILLMSIIAIYILTRPIFGYFALLIFLPLIISFKFMGVLRTKRLHDVSRTEQKQLNMRSKTNSAEPITQFHLWNASNHSFKKSNLILILVLSQIKLFLMN